MNGNRMRKYLYNDRYGFSSKLYEDDDGKILTAEEVDELSPWEIDERGIHVAEGSV